MRLDVFCRWAIPRVDNEFAAVGPREELECEQGKFLTCTIGDDQHISGEVMPCVMLRWLRLLFT